MNFPKIFYKLKKLQIKQIKDKVSLAMRKCKTIGKRITVEQVLSLMMLLCMMKDLECYENFEVPHHTGRVQKKCFCNDQTTWCTNLVLFFLSCGDYMGTFTSVFGKTIKQKELTEQETIEMTLKEKCELINSDPVTCARYFDNRIHIS